MEVIGNVRFNYFTDIFKIHLGAICHLAVTAVNFHDEDGSFPCKMVCRSERPTNAVVEICTAFLFFEEYGVCQLGVYMFG